MQTVILAAGQGTRLRPLSESVPKPMLPVAGRPIAAHVADAAVAGGADELVFVTGYMAEVVESYFGETYRGVPVSYATQDEQLGTAHAVRAAREHLTEAFAVLNGDNLYDPESIAELFANGPAIGVFEVENPSNYGVLSTESGRVTDIIEKPTEPPTNLANAGVYLFPAEAREFLDVPMSERGEHELTDVLARVIEDHDVTPVELERWMDVGRPWELLEANELLLAEGSRRIDGEVAPDATIEGAVVIEEGATVQSGVTIEGPAYVGPGCSVGPNAYIRGATLLEGDVHVGQSVEVKNSVIMRGTNVPHLTYVGDSVLGRNVNFGAGTNVANLRHDGEDVKLTVKGERVSTGRRKFGVVVGHGAKTAINTSLAPGVILSGGATTTPGESVRRDR
ncbi:bifunctional sugar-1-phosphate nucleotidylyltransferase/acetyltransferase [Halalkalicoccus jeotgali]|uniref:Bifunctional protein GlmU n=1 Tax=Halalkalicoccus jeotgali (strain DSM 18796 / CECT 7217 / JCM 14584 / KCTC 4019 / B3) TaxID=795797 RepID=D8J5S9_HALJB|nr:bifunctional sugar-1-phosphate nucleotidylyltransferase/acetyltransferase [Halalkalicoccus jeotgali]ADJ13735.1 glucose-1-phosphate thymidylyltransferase [Halalkalicoccus jeotgali B3]ELY34219.1 glucose-1-phosphate thymidylyltransferase [Halalkalicoccus jeotgali B3]